MVNEAVMPTWCSVAGIVVQAEQQRADGRRAAFAHALVPAQAGDDAIGRSLVLDLQHRAFARLVRSVARLGDHAIESGAFELAQPLRGHPAVAGGRRHAQRRLRIRQQGFQRGTAQVLRQRQQGSATHGEKVEGDE